MKIIIAPSKTQSIHLNASYSSSQPLYLDEANTLNGILSKFTFDELKSIYKSSDKVAQQTYNSIQKYQSSASGQAIFSYTGAVFREIQATALSSDSINFLNEHLFILSAHYGVLKPLDLIKSYRLDFKSKLPETNLKDFWSKKMNNCFDDEIIINLASTEFSSLINKPMINIEFKENRNGSYKVIGTYAKMARGAMIHQIADKKIDNLNQLKDLLVNQYRYNSELSTDKSYVFTDM